MHSNQSKLNLPLIIFFMRIKGYSIFLGYYIYIVIFLFCHFILKMFAFKTVKDEFECSTAGRNVKLYFQCSIEQQDEMGKINVTIIILNSTKR